MTKVPHKFDGITVDGKDLVIYLDEQTCSEIEKVSSREIREKSVGIFYQPGTSKYTNISGCRSERRDVATTGISEEVSATLNFLLKYEGEKSVTDFVNSNGTQHGPLEAALKENAEQLSLLRRKLQEINIEIARCEAMDEALTTALNLKTGKTHPRLSDSSMPLSQPTKARQGDRVLQLKQILGGLSLPKKQVLTMFMTETGLQRNTANSALDYSIKHGKVAQDDNKMLTWAGE